MLTRIIRVTIMYFVFINLTFENRLKNALLALGPEGERVIYRSCSSNARPLKTTDLV
jgi:hypothetical protein